MQVLEGVYMQAGGYMFCNAAQFYFAQTAQFYGQAALPDLVFWYCNLMYGIRKWNAL